MWLQIFANIAQIISVVPTIGQALEHRQLGWRTVVWGAIALVAVLGLAARFGRPRGRLQILHAFAGTGAGAYRDTTALVAARIDPKENRIDMKVDRTTLYRDDPFPGERKHLIVVYSVAGVTQPPVTVDEGMTLNIP